MKRQDTIGPLSLSNFLKHGAFLRWDGDWFFVGLSETYADARKSSPKDAINVWSPQFFDLSSPVLSNLTATRLPVGSPDLINLEKYLRSRVEEMPKSQRSWDTPSRNDYKARFATVKERLALGSLKKAVPFMTQESAGSLQDDEKCHLLYQCLNSQAALYAFGFWQESGGIIGTTPELLFKRDGTKVETMALAGTIAKDENFSAKEFVNSAKMQDEHQWVVSDIQQKLQDFGEVKLHPTEVVELPHLAHLKTKIEMTLKYPVSNQELVTVLHPTPALGVAPRSELGWFKSLPMQAKRRRFGAPFLMEWQDKAIALVCIRSLEWDSMHCWISAGGGVVKESSFEGEWAEIETKFSSIWKNLELQRMTR